MTPSDPAALARWAFVAAEVGDQVYGPLRAPLAELVARTSHLYTRSRDDFAPASGVDALQARLRFYLVRDLRELAGPVHELELAEALPTADPLRVLDLGAGLGTTSFALLHALGPRVAEVHIDALDQSADALRGFAALADRAPELGLPAVRVHARAGRITEAPAGAPWDIILLGLFLNELPFAEREALVRSLRTRLHERGSLIIVEPALKETSRALHRLRDGLDPEWTVFAPCLRTGPCPMLETDRDWCHEDELQTLPPSLESVARAAGLRGDRRRFSYLTLRRDGRRLADAVGHESWRVVSQALKTKGKLELYGCGEAGRVRLTRLDRHAAEPNADFGEAHRGQVLAIEGAQPKGQGLRVTADTRVRRRR